MLEEIEVKQSGETWESEQELVVVARGPVSRSTDEIGAVSISHVLRLKTNGIKGNRVKDDGWSKREVERERERRREGYSKGSLFAYSRSTSP